MKRNLNDLAKLMAEYLIQDDREGNDWKSQQEENGDPCNDFTAIRNGLNSDVAPHIYEVAAAWLELDLRKDDGP